MMWIERNEDMCPGWNISLSNGYLGAFIRFLNLRILIYLDQEIIVLLY